VQLLVEGGADVDGRHNFRPFGLLLRIVNSWYSRRLFASERFSQFPLFNELFNLLFTYSTDLKTSQEWLINILFISTNIAVAHRNHGFVDNDLVNFHSLYDNDAAIDGLADMYRRLLLTGASIDINASLGLLDIRHHEFSFTKAIVEIVGYTSRAGRSDKLLNVVLSSLSASQINELREKLLEQKQKRMTEPVINNGEDTLTDDALQWIGDVKTTSSLKHLTRCTILGAMSNRMLKVGASSLRLPKLLEEYVQLHF